MFLFRNPVIFWAYLAFTWSVGCVEYQLSQLAKSDLLKAYHTKSVMNSVSFFFLFFRKN